MFPNPRFFRESVKIGKILSAAIGGFQDDESMLIDTHAHLNFSVYREDLDNVLKRARESGVEKIICASSNVADSETAIALAKQYPGVIHAAVGIHPQETDRQLEKLQELADQKEVVAIGECGLDYSDKPAADQVFLFQSQIEIAQKLDLPLIIHTRDAFTDTLEILRKYQNLRGVFHCYSNGKKGIKRVEELGFLFGLDGNLTYDQGLQIVAGLIPLEKIILETDSPLLTPEPFRGKQNEPANVKIIAQCLAKLKNVSLEEVEKITTENAGRLFKI